MFARDVACGQTSFAGAVDIPLVRGDEREVGRGKVELFRGVEINRGRGFPLLHFFDGDEFLYRIFETGAGKHLPGRGSAAIGERGDANPGIAQELDAFFDVGMNRESGEALDHAFHLLRVRLDLVFGQERRECAGNLGETFVGAGDLQRKGVAQDVRKPDLQGAGWESEFAQFFVERIDGKTGFDDVEDDGFWFVSHSLKRRFSGVQAVAKEGNSERGRACSESEQTQRASSGDGIHPENYRASGQPRAFSV